MPRFAWLAGFALAACGASPVATPDAGVASCEGAAQVVAYAPGVAVKDAAGDRTYVLRGATPSPPAVGNNSWTLQVEDGQGQALQGLSLSASAFMPQHGHGSSVVPQVTSNGDGTYQIAPLYFFMPGVWRVIISDADGGASDQSGAFYFCVEG